jgi:hypothetical protein
VAVFLGSVQDVYVFGRASLVTIAAALPWLGVLAVPAYGLRRLLRGRQFSLPSIRSGGDDPDADDAAEPATEDESSPEADEDETPEGKANGDQRPDGDVDDGDQ